MTREVGLIGTVVGLLALSSTGAHAQNAPAAARRFVNVNVAVQTGSQDVTKTFDFDLYEEPASVSVTHGTGGVLFDITGGTSLRGPWSVGLNFNRRSKTSDGALTGSVPDPIKFDRPRAVTGTVPDIDHQETWIAPLVFYDLPMTMSGWDKVAAQAFVGPAFATLSEDQVSGATVTESGSTPQVATTVEKASKTLVGFQAGVDLRYTITPRVGAGVLLRYQRASGTVGNVDVTLGGFQIGGGIRLQF